jgi:hypothetical protein
MRTKESKEWIKSLVEGRTGYQAPEHQKPDPAAMTTTKRIATRYFQLKKKKKKKKKKKPTP